MISGNIRQLPAYFNQEIVNPILNFLDREDFETLSAGKHALEGGIFAIVIKTKSRDLSGERFEAHRKNLDLHCLISGKEVLRFTSANNLHVDVPYSLEEDYLLYHSPQQYSQIGLTEKQFILFYPEDAHCAQGHLNEENMIVKVVFKIPLSLQNLDMNRFRSFSKKDMPNEMIDNNNTKKITVLVTGVGSCGASEGTVKALKMTNRYRIIGTEMKAQSAMSFRVNVGYKVPRADDPNYFPILNKILLEEKVEVLIPGSDAEMEMISNNLDQIPPNTFVLAHPKETVNICRDAWKTYIFLKENGFHTPESYLPDEPKEIGFPLIVKDRFGGGSKNNLKVEDETELEYALKIMRKKNIKPIIQKYVGSMDEEYTTGVLFGEDRNLISTITFRRSLIAGASGNMVYKEFKEINEYAAKIVSKLKVKGSLNIQSRLVDGKVYAFEINPRFSGSTSARAGVGVNEPDMAIDSYYLHKNVPNPPFLGEKVIMRCFQEVYGELNELEKLEQNKCIFSPGEVKDCL